MPGTSIDSDATVPPPSKAQRRGRVLVVDDSHPVRDSLKNLLEWSGFEALTARDGVDASSLLERETIDVVVSDIRMPRMDGMSLLALIRRLEPDLPVVLLTAAPELGSAIKAVELGAFRYLTKPTSNDELVGTVERAYQLARLARIRRQAASLAAGEDEESARRELRRSFERTLATLEMAYQPLIDTQAGEVIGYEALLRCTFPALNQPNDVLRAAERLDCVFDLGRRVRREVAATMASQPSLLFVNLHPLELMDDELLDPSSPLAPHAASVVLEVTERAALNQVDRLAERVADLRRLGFRIAVDDLGAGYASLNSFAQLQPDFVKLDMALVQYAPTDPVRRRLVRSMIEVCAELGIQVVGEGVETREQRDTLEQLGCRLMQGYLFARPGKAYPPVTL